VWCSYSYNFPLVDCVKRLDVNIQTSAHILHHGWGCVGKIHTFPEVYCRPFTTQLEHGTIPRLRPEFHWFVLNGSIDGTIWSSKNEPVASHKNKQIHLHIVMRAEIVHNKTISSVVRQGTNLIENHSKEIYHSIASGSLPRPYILPSSTIEIPRYSKQQIPCIRLDVHSRLLYPFPDISLVNCTIGSWNFDATLIHIDLSDISNSKRIWKIPITPYFLFVAREKSLVCSCATNFPLQSKPLFTLCYLV